MHLKLGILYKLQLSCIGLTYWQEVQTAAADPATYMCI